MSEFIIIIIALAIYFLPSIIGYNHRNANSICLLNLLLGWTVLGWIVAMIWAVSQDKHTFTIQNNSNPIPSKTPIKSSFENSLRVFLAGCHLPTRKNYILKNGWDTMPVDLEAEPTNKFDKNAIAVKHEGKLIGYIPEDKTHLVHPILEKEYEATFDSMDEEESYSKPGETHLTVYLRINYN